MRPGSGTTAAAMTVAVAIPCLSWQVNGFFTPGMVAVGVVAGFCVWYRRLLFP